MTKDELKPFYTVVKVQNSIAGEPKTLIYAKGKRFWTECDRSIGESWLGKRAKGFFRARISKKKIHIIKEVNPRDW